MSEPATETLSAVEREVPYPPEKIWRAHATTPDRGVAHEERLQACAGHPIRFGSSSEEVPLNWNNWLRQIHRWLAIAFTVAVIVNIVALVQQAQAVWIGLLALFPLVLLMLTGLYLFVLPYAAKWRSGRRTVAYE